MSQHQVPRSTTTARGSQHTRYITVRQLTLASYSERARTPYSTTQSRMLIIPSAFWFSCGSGQNLLYKCDRPPQRSVKSTSVSLARLRPMLSPPFAKAMCSYFITSSFASSHPWLPGLTHSPFSFLSILLLTLRFRDVEGNHPWQGATLLEALILGKLESKSDSVCPWDHQPNGLNHFHQLEAHELWWASSGTMAKYDFSTLCKICVLLTHTSRSIYPPQNH